MVISAKLRKKTGIAKDLLFIFRGIKPFVRTDVQAKVTNHNHNLLTTKILSNEKGYDDDGHVGRIVCRTGTDQVPRR